MIRHLSIPALLAVVFLVSVAVHAQTGQAPCGSFQQLQDGKWTVRKQIKIEYGSASAILNPGTILSPGAQVAGVDIYAALQRSCQKPNGAK
jgi:hypothetical protein